MGRRRNTWHDLQAFIEEFEASPVCVTEFRYSDHDYSNPESARNALKRAIKTSGYRLDVMRRKTRVFIYKE